MADPKHVPLGILVVRVGALGDTLMATPTVRALKRQNPAASIDFLCSAAAAPLLELNRNIDEVLALQWRNLPYWLSREKRNLVRRLRVPGYDLAVLLESAVRYRRLLERSDIGTIRGFSTTPFDPELHSIVNNLRAAGFDEWERPMLEMDLPVSKDDESAAAEILAGLSGKSLVGLHAGYGPSGRKPAQENRLKGWSVSNFRELGDRLLEAGFNLVLTGSAPDAGLNREISRGWEPARFLDLAGKTSVRTLASVLGRLRVFISVDSGPAHMAAAVGSPLIVLWGPAKLQQVRPLGFRGPVEILRYPVPCAPCYDTPAMKNCRMNLCMQGITPDLVMRTVDRILSRSR